MTDLDHPDADIPYSEDLQSPEGARAWADAAEQKRPQRAHFRHIIVQHLQSLAPGARVLELGSGPGWLAEQALEACPHLSSYTLFDFSAPMLDMSRQRVGRFSIASFVLGDFRSEDWTRSVAGVYDAVASMQAVHEVRHKRHVPRLYRQIYGVVAPGGMVLICDRVPEDDSRRSTSLFMSEQEQERAIIEAGFVDVRVLMTGEALALCLGRKSA